MNVSIEQGITANISANISISRLEESDTIFFESANTQRLRDQFPFNQRVKISQVDDLRKKVEGYPSIFSLCGTVMCLTPEPVERFIIGKTENSTPLNNLIGSGGYKEAKGIAVLIEKIPARVEVEAQVESDSIVGPALCPICDTFLDQWQKIFPPEMKVRIFSKDDPSAYIEGYPRFHSVGVVLLSLVLRPDVSMQLSIDKLIQCVRKLSQLERYGTADLIIEQVLV